MKKHIFFASLFFTHLCFGMNWNEIFENYEAIIPKIGILQEQYQAYKQRISQKVEFLMEKMEKICKLFFILRIK